LQYVTLGKTGLRVSRLCFGSLTIGPLQANLAPREGAKVIRAALEQGVNFIDTAELYGTYPHIRAALEGWREHVVIASKCYAYSREGAQQSLELALRELGVDYLDIFMLHEQESRLTLQGHWAALEYFWEAKAKGIIGAVGISTHTVEAVRAAAEIEGIDVIHPLINISGLGIKDGTVTEMLAAIALAHGKGKGIYSMKPFGGGNLLNRKAECLQFVLDQPCIDAVAIGMQNVDEVAANIAMINGEPVAPALAARLAQQPRRLHIDEWCEGCGQCVARCPNGALSIKDGKAVVNPAKCVLCSYCSAACPEFFIKVI